MNKLEKIIHSNWTGAVLGAFLAVGLAFGAWHELTKPPRKPISVSEIMVESAYGTGKPCSTDPQRTCITLKRY